MACRRSARGPLAMEPDELAAFIRENGITFPVLTPEDKAEAEALAQWEAKLHRLSRAGRSAARSRAGSRGSSKVLAADRLVAQACLKEAGGRSEKAKTAFINQIRAPDNVTSGTAKNRWYDATEPYGRTRRPR